MTSHDVLTYLDDIRIQSEYIAQALPRMTYEEFLQDPLYNSGIVRFVEIIGEAAKQIPDSVREQYPDKTIVIRNQRQLDKVQDRIGKLLEKEQKSPHV